MESRKHNDNDKMHVNIFYNIHTSIHYLDLFII